MKNLRSDRTGKLATWSLIASVSLASFLILFTAACKPKNHLRGGQVHGFVVAQFPNAPATLIHLPDVTIYLRNTLSGKKSGKVTTNALGHFITGNEKPGPYQVCAEAAGFVAACDSKVITVVEGTVVLDHDVMLVPDGQVVQGRVTFKDGNPCFQDNNRFNTFATTKVSLHDSSGKLISQAHIANNRGYYVLPQVPGAGTYRIDAECDGFTGSQSVTLAGLQLTGGTPINVGLANNGPQITSVTVSLNGTMVQQAAPGSTVTALVRAYDPDGDSLHYKWTDGTPSFPGQDSSTIQWTLPTTAQANLLMVEVRDGKGGYARGFVTVSTGTFQPVFGGKVIDRATGRGISGAMVTINGARLTSAANGIFKFTGRKDDFALAIAGLEKAPRYVINVRKPGYALLSRVVYAPTPQMNLSMDRAARTTCSPSSPCAATEQGNVITTHVHIDANSMVDQNGNPASVPVNVDVHGYDMTLSNPIPGDYAALDKSGNPVTMNSFGAINVDLTDANGNSYNLAPGKTAQISIPVNTSMLSGATPPATLPLWSYNEQTGIWQEEVTATYDAVSHAYVGNVSHFTSWNADAVFTNTACVFITIDPNTGPEIPFNLRGAPSNPPGYVNHQFTTDPTDAAGFAFYRLIPNSVVAVEVHPASGPDYVMGTFTVNAGPTIDSGSTNYDAAPYYGIPPNPATECNGFDVSTNQPPVIKLTVPTSPTFLTGLAGATPTTTQYFEAVGALDSSGGATTNRSKFSLWKQTNGLGQGPGGSNSPNEVEAIYFNNADLQFGRDMHCLQGGGTPANPTNVACYVTNYGQGGLPQGDPQTGITLAEAHSGPIASVAMEYNLSFGTSAVRFYAYKADDSLLDSPVLDQQTTIVKPIPQICMACHGGYNSVSNANNVDNASFIAFDIYSFLYDNTSTGIYGTTPVGGVPAYGSVTVNQEDIFRQLNKMVLTTNPNQADANQPIINLINGWYNNTAPPCNVNTTNCVLQDTYAPPPPLPGWTSHTALYQTIPRVYCRTCHASQGTGSTVYPDWTQYSDFAGPGTLVPTFVCSANLMPYAQVPFKKFWLSANPSAPEYLADPTLGLNITGGCPR